MDDISRFQELIQPIKDLASSWDIDISEKLEEYLEEIMNLRFEPGPASSGQNNKLNFAEAALLIQGSTTIYSKKVEYLYQLVLKSIEFITNKKSNYLKTPEGEEDAAISQTTNNTSMNAINNLIHWGNDVQYLLLDDMIEEGTNIDLKPVTPGTLTPYKGDTSNTKMNSTTNLSHNMNTSRMSISIIHSMMSEEQGVGSLKLTGSCVDSSGALLVSGFAGNAFNNPSKRKSLGSLGGNISNIMNNSVLLPNLSHLNDQQNLYMNLNQDGTAGGDQPPWNEDDDYYPPHHDDDCDAGLGLDHLYEKNDKALQTPIKQEPQREKTTGFAAFRHGLTSGLLDPHVVVSEPKPIKKGRPYRLPPLLVLKDKIIKYNNSDSKKKLHFPSVFDIFLTHYEKKFAQYWKDIVQIQDNHYGSEEEKKPELLLSSYSVPIRGLYDGSLVPLLRLKQKLYKKKKLQATRAKKVNKLLYEEGEDIISSILNNKKKRLNPMRSEARAALDGEEDNHDQEMMMLYGDDYVDHEYYKEDEEKKNAKDGELKKVNPDEILFTEYLHKNEELHQSKNGDLRADDIIESYFGDDNDYDNDYDEELAMRMDKALNEDLLRASAHTYEMICKQYIESFHRGANAYAMETQLSKRVNDWTVRLEPILQTQEDQAPFDIHAYADNFLSKIDQVVKHKRSSLSSEEIKSLDSLVDEEEIETPHSTQEDKDDKILAVAEMLEVLHDDDFKDLGFSDKQSVDLGKLQLDEPEKFAQLHEKAQKRTKKFSKLFTVSFNELAQDLKSSEVCRLFLACLQLANFGNVDVQRSIDINKRKSLEEQEDSEKIVSTIDNSFKLVLLNNKRSLNVEEFLAPSLNSPAEDDEDLINFNKMVQESYKKDREPSEDQDTQEVSDAPKKNIKKRNSSDAKNTEGEDDGPISKRPSRASKRK